MKHTPHLVMLACFLAPSVSQATDCSRWPQFASNEAYLQPLSIEAANTDDHLNGSNDLEGIIIAADLEGRDLQLDVLHYPGDVTAAAALRVIFMIGRLSDESYDRLVLIDEGERLFYIAEPDLRSVGCRFIWRRQAGENPIALMRDFYSNLYFVETDQAVVRGLNGSLLGDTQRVLQANNEVVLPAWILSAIE
ncbi:hypothetical protein HKCCSP123_16200 [Rhodobacterales bacterium HKCCSP123]|nr:hypothetical protein [Rhodobacterales bacterium HKCCSP123]